MRKSLVVIALALGVLAPSTPALAVDPYDQRPGIPAYLPPTAGDPEWDRLITDAPEGSLVVANVYNGPGRPDQPELPVWRDRIRRAHDEGLRVLGYVWVDRLGLFGDPQVPAATRAAAQAARMMADVTAWYQLYSAGGLIDGIFLDEANQSCGPPEQPRLYVDTMVAVRAGIQALHEDAWAHSDRAIVVTNQGGETDRCFYDSGTASIHLTFEGTYADYARCRTLECWYANRAWEATAPARRIWHLVYGAPSRQELNDSLWLSEQRNAGFVYVVPYVPTYWERLPPVDYWEHQLGC